MSPTPTVTPERRALLHALAQQAAAWWRGRLQGHGYLSDFDNGDRSQAGEMAQIMASMAALSSPQPSADKFERFEQLLTEALLQHMLHNPMPERPTSHVLDVDYGPNYELGQLAREAGVSGFPWKTTMWVRWAADLAECYVEVRAGYNRPYQRLPSVGNRLDKAA